ncbi:apolipoprotein B receptor [Marmota monax]|uniref:Apolipoprotein B receptor n=1 Tax=Marmota monax TaxID=9995 RepID=A0A834V6N1_MARMO|nr:apolipoprotein B receptor [Marmota monax]
MDFLRLHLPGLHQALRGALDSFNAFLSYLIGDEVPTVQQEAQVAKELQEVAAGKPEKTVEVEAQEALEGLRDRRSQGFGKPGGPGEAGRFPEGSSAAEQTWGWGKGSSQGSQADRQDVETREAARASGDQESSTRLEAGKKSEAGSRAQQDRSGHSKEGQEPGEQEVSRGETPRNWEHEEEEEEEVRVTEPGMARGVESEWTWHQEPEVKAGSSGQKVAGDSGETEQVVSEIAAETENFEVRGPGREEEGVVVVRNGQSIGTQGTGVVESEDRAALGREEARITSSDREQVGAALAREESDLPGVRETEYGPVPGERIPEVTGIKIQEEVKGETEVKLFPQETQVLGTEETEEAVEGQTAGREAEGPESEEEAGEGFEGDIDQHGKEAEGRQDEQIRADGARLEEEEEVQAKGDWEEEGSCLVTEAELALDKEDRGDDDLEAAPEARPGEEFVEERSKEAQRSQETLEEEWDDLKFKVTKGQEPELMGGVLTPTEQPEEGQGVQEELGRVSDLRKEEMEGRLEEHSRHMGSIDPEVPEGEDWENQRRRGRESSNTQEEKTDTEDEEEEATGGQALEAKAKGGWESDLSEIQGCAAQEGEGFVAENQGLQEIQREEAEKDQSPGETEARETEDSEVEASGPSEADLTSRGGWRLEEAALGLQNQEDAQTSSLAPEIVEDEAVLVVRAAGAEEGPEFQESGAVWVGENGRGWNSEGREEAEGEAELVEAAEGGNRGGQDLGLEGSAGEEVTGRDGEAEAFEARAGDQAGVGGSAMVEGSGGVEGVTSGSQAARAEGAEAKVEAEGFLGEQLLEEAGGWQAREQGTDSEGQCGDHHPEGEGQRLPHVEDPGTGGQRSEAKETDPEGLEDVQGQEVQLTQQGLVEALPGPLDTAEAAGSARGDTHSSWCEALLPGPLLDVSVPRSRALLSRSSSQRRSRPSFRRVQASEEPEDPPSPQPEEGLSAPEQRPLQLEEAPEPSPPRPEGTPVPARRKTLGLGFGLAHPGMMQELQARLGRPKPQ